MKLDMTKGNILPLIITFAVPLFFSNLFQQFYNIADTAIVGHTLGDHALSAVGAVHPSPGKRKPGVTVRARVQGR